MPISNPKQSNSWVLIIAAIATAGVFVIALGLLYPLLALILQKQGYSATLIGANSAMTALGVILSAPLIPRLAQRFGAARFAAICAALTTVLLTLIGAYQDIVFWFPARLLLGMVINGTYVISETWVNALATNHNRGRIMGFYTTILAGGFALGPFILAITGSSGWPPFLVVMAITAITTVGLLLLRKRLPEFAADGKGSIRAFLPLAPVLLAAVGIYAFFEQVTLAILPIYGLHFGLTERLTVIAVGVLVSGNVIMQYPIGWIADRLSRRTVLMGCAFTAAAGGLSLPFVIQTTVLLWPLLFIWGAVAFGIYTVTLAELGDRFSGSMLLAGNAAFALMWGLGGVLGLPIAGGAMDLFGPHGYPASVTVVFALLVILATFRQPSFKETRLPAK